MSELERGTSQMTTTETHRTTTFLDLLRRQMSGVDRTRRKRTLKERLRFKCIGCCGPIRRLHQPNNTLHSPTTSSEDELETRFAPGSDIGAGASSGSGMNLATALEAERYNRGDPTEVDMTPTRVSLMRLLDETAERAVDDGARITASASRIRDFYMEITFHFESSVIPFVGRIAPSDTYRIWKRGCNLRADMTLAGFDGFRIQRSDQTFLFLGDGYASCDGKVSLPPGALIVLSHKEKEVTNALEGAGAQPTEAEVANEVKQMSQTNMYRPGIDVTQAELVPQANWRRQERTESVGSWKAKVYDMMHVMVSVKSRSVPGAMSDEEMFAVDRDGDRMENGGENDGFEDVLTSEERKQLDSALLMEVDEENDHHQENGGSLKEKKGWFGWNKKGSKPGYDGGSEDNTATKVKKGSKLGSEKGKSQRCDDTTKDNKGNAKKKKSESEYKKGLRPVLWLTPDFPLKTEELLPLLDILANKVKAVRRLRELLTTKLPTGTFPVKIAIPIIPTVRVLVTFTKFEELQPSEEFSTPPSSPVFHDAKSSDNSSWVSWMKGARGGGQASDCESNKYRDDEVDPFLIPSDYTWVDSAEKKRRMKAKKARIRKNRKHGAPKPGSSSSRSNQEADA